VSTTVYEYDADGRVSSTTTTCGPDWLDSDRWLALADQRIEDEKCVGCGQPRSRAWHPDQDGWYDAVVYECQACEAIQQAQQDDKRLPGSYVGVTDSRPADRPLPDLTWGGSAHG
jgi:hypothetical protein